VPKVKYNPQPIPRACHACGEMIDQEMCPVCQAYNEIDYEHEPPVDYEPEDND